MRGRWGPSIWRATAPDTTFPVLPGGVDTEVLVVGAGVTGLTCGALLAEAGAEVIVIEARRIGAGTTGATTGKVTSQHGLIYQELVEQHGEEIAAAYGRANESAIGLVRDLTERHRIDADFVPADAYIYTQDDSKVESMQREVEVAQRLGLPASWTDSVDLPFDVAGAVRFQGQAQLHAMKYLHGLSRAVTERPGCAVHEGTRALDVHGDDNRIAVDTDRGRITAQHVVLATLIPIVDRGFEFAREEPLSAYGVAGAIEGHVPEGMYLSAEQPTRSIRHYLAADETFLIVVGGSHKTGQERQTTFHGDRLADFARQRFGLDVRYRWSAHDYKTVDLLPFAGEAAFADQVYVATGFNKWGLTNGTTAARLIADLVSGHDNPYADVFRPTRAKLTASAKKFLQHNLDTAKRFVGDRLRPDARSIDEIPAGGAGVVLEGGEYLAVSKDDGGQVTARSAVCRHLGCIVQWNVAERTWDCPCHGSRYAPDGEVLTGPATRPLTTRGDA